MMTYLSYLAYSGVLLIGLYLIYKGLLAKETFHRFNRAFLLLSYLVAFGTLPVMLAGKSLVRLFSTPEEVKVIGVGTLPKLDIEPYSFPEWAAWTLIAVYCLGAVALLLVLLRTVWRIEMLAETGEKATIHGTEVCVVKDSRFAPFSWGGRIFVTEDCLNDPSIIAHEKKHLEARHWLDLLLAQAVITLNWFNPAAWLIRHELQDVHEFEADKAVAESGANLYDYQMMLIEKASGLKFAALANCLNHSTLSRRINMMQRKRSSRAAHGKAVFALPVLALLVWFVSFDAIASAITPKNITQAPKIQVEKSYSIQTLSSDSLSIYLDGEKIDNTKINDIDPKNIGRIDVKKDEDERAIYIYTKKK